MFNGVNAKGESPKYEIAANLGGLILGAFDAETEVDGLISAAESIEAHVKAQDATYWIGNLKTINDKPIDKEMKNEALRKMCPEVYADFEFK